MKDFMMMKVAVCFKRRLDSEKKVTEIRGLIYTCQYRNFHIW